jgi:hypothetical protein
MFITADQLLMHAIGDYVLQSDWMATKKAAPGAQGMLAAVAHALAYALPFLLIARSPGALAFIASTHFVIDRWRLARYLVWAKNFLAPMWFERVPAGGEVHWCSYNEGWSECSSTGYHKDRPPWMAVWLYIIADNVLHVICNGLAIKWM